MRLGQFHIIFICCLIANFSCKQKSDKDAGAKIFETSEIRLRDKNDILKYKVKESYFNETNIGLSTSKILLNKIKENNYSLNIKADYDKNTLKNLDNYYYLLSIYPYDNELELLEKSRQKYGFERYSIKIHRLNNDSLLIGREINTKLKKARAITLILMGYSDKQKYSELIMRDVKFTNN